MTKAVVLGSGIIGLYTVFHLLEKQIKPSDITVVAEYFADDQSINYTSPWAGGNFCAISPSDPLSLEMDKFTYLNLFKVQKALGGPEKSGLDMMPMTEFWDYDPPSEKLKSLQSYLKDFKILSRDELAKKNEPKIKFGISYTTWNFNCPFFLKKMSDYMRSKGILFVQRKLTHISQAFLDESTKVVFNCTGIGARDLVKDHNVFPGRGQVVVIKAPHIKENCVRWGKSTATYIIPRPYSQDSLVLGGFIQKDCWSGDTYGDQTEDILRRTTALLPQILEQNAHGSRIEDLEIKRVAAGLRPYRHGGPRVEEEQLPEGKSVVHCYGQAGTGYQSGMGWTNTATDLWLRRRSSKL
ncbi:FAD-dependent oxidoreductase [Ascoidea rubescens DSM 1968]|uniref:Putative D-amino acid oxidase n=1 Tax=Ascoidea rubescens DSM 1968 TaxID=1344418 RepID=A0A1D2VJZ3_9ASCO|nr:putative D-amino acid oxidase [Ascoidea rubescens DSM 1968]ODV61923.1 putative D-amino acid oxidase [Ascoidea rubescens DSM 1968]